MDDSDSLLSMKKPGRVGPRSFGPYLLIEPTDNSPGNPEAVGSVDSPIRRAPPLLAALLAHPLLRESCRGSLHMMTPRKQSVGKSNLPESYDKISQFEAFVKTPRKKSGPVFFHHEA